MTSYPAPAEPTPTPAGAGKPPAAAWLVPLAAVVAIIGGVLPWFKPIGYVNGTHGSLGVTAHAWQGGAVGVIGPVLLVIVGIVVLLRLVGRKPAAPGKNPVRRWGLIALLFALATLGLQLAARGLILHATATVNGKSLALDKLAALEGATAYSRGTQIGFWITTAAAVLALIGGVIMMVSSKKASTSSAGSNSQHRAAPATAEGAPLPD
jgi:hypothetical protein